MGRNLNTVNRPTLWTKHTDYLTVNGVPGELSKDALGKKTVTIRKHSDDLNRLEVNYQREMKTLISDKKAMEASMLIYSEKMRRISRERMPVTSTSSSLTRSDSLPKEKWPSCTKLDDISEKNSVTEAKGTQSPRVRSYSDASCYSNLRGKYTSKKKKISVDISNKGQISELTTLTPSPDGEETSDSGIESPKVGSVRQRRKGVVFGPQVNGTIPEVRKSQVSSAADKPKIRRLPLIQNFQRTDDSDSRGSSRSSKHSLDFENIGEDNVIDDVLDGDRLFKIYGKRWNRHPRTDSEVFSGKSRKSKLKPLTRSESLDEYDIRQNKTACDPIPDWFPTHRKPEYCTPEYSDTFQAAMQCLSLSETETSNIASDFEFCGTESTRKISDISSEELHLLAAQRGRRASSSSPNSPSDASYAAEDVHIRTHSVPLPSQPLKSALKKPDSNANLAASSSQRKSVTFNSPDRVTLIFREREEDLAQTSRGRSEQSETTIVVVRQ